MCPITIAMTGTYVYIYIYIYIYLFIHLISTISLEKEQVINHWKMISPCFPWYLLQAYQETPDKNHTATAPNPPILQPSKQQMQRPVPHGRVLAGGDDAVETDQVGLQMSPRVPGTTKLMGGTGPPGNHECGLDMIRHGIISKLN